MALVEYWFIGQKITQTWTICTSVWNCFVRYDIRWPLFYYLHQISSSLLIVFVQWTQLSEYWTHDTTTCYWFILVFRVFSILEGFFSLSVWNLPHKFNLYLILLSGLVPPIFLELFLELKKKFWCFVIFLEQAQVPKLSKFNLTASWFQLFGKDFETKKQTHFFTIYHMRSKIRWDKN